MSPDPQDLRIRLFAAARAAAGTDVLVVPAGTVESALAEAVSRAPGLADVLPRCSLLLDGVAVHDRSAVAPGGAELDVLPPFAGG